MYASELIELTGRAFNLFKVKLDNWWDNTVYLTRHTSLRPQDINDLSWFEYEMYLTTLKGQLDKEAEAHKTEEKKQQKAANFNSIGSQMKSWMSKFGGGPKK